MPKITACAAPALVLTLVLHAPLSGQGVSRFQTPTPALHLEGPARPGAFISVTGRRAAVFGDETGALELWTWPLKLVRDLDLSFGIPDYDDPIPGARVATRVDVGPAVTTVTYTHATFTVREHILVPQDEPGGVILLDVETVRPLRVNVRMHADFDLAWPGSFGGQYITWDEDRGRFLLSQGGVHHFNGMVGSPFAVEGTTHPAHDAPTIPSRFTLRFDPQRTTTELIPIVFAGGAMSADSVAAAYDRILQGAAAYWRDSAEHYRRVLDSGPTVRSPEPQLDAAYDWARVNLDEQLVCNPGLGCGLVAGFGRAGAGNFRPGFGWYFGGDAAINSFAMDGTGQFALVRTGLEFLARHQRADGKIPHEISHAAPWLPWFTDYPYTWYHGDTTPYWIVACEEYWRASGDVDFLRHNWPAILSAFRWSRATDADGDGLMENPLAGAGAIEVGGLGESLHTDIYLGGMWAVALGGMRDMARAVGDDTLAAQAASMQQRALATLERQFWLEDAGIYAFALLEPGGEAAAGSREATAGGLRVNDAVTVWPTTAMSFGLLDPERSDRMLARLAAADVTTDWGTRLLSAEHPLYEPLHYNNGAVWPFMTGFTALADYRYHRYWNGYDLLRDIARTTFDFARGRNPELMSGAFYRTLDTTVPQQFFATSMLVTPLVRGLLGLTQDAPARALEIAPHLPADWDSLQVDGVAVGSDHVDVAIRRGHGSYTVHLVRHGRGRPLHVRVAPALPLGSRLLRATINDADADVQVETTSHDVHPSVELTLDDEALVELEYQGGVELVPARETVRVGDAPHGLRILDFSRDGRDYVLRLQGLAGAEYPVDLRAGRPRRLRGAALVSAGDGVVRLRVRFPGESGGGYVPAEVRFQD